MISLFLFLASLRMFKLFPQLPAYSFDVPLVYHLLFSVLLFLRKKFHAWQWCSEAVILEDPFFSALNWGYFYSATNMTGSFWKEILNVCILF